MSDMNEEVKRQMEQRLASQLSSQSLQDAFEKQLGGRMIQPSVGQTATTQTSTPIVRPEFSKLDPQIGVLFSDLLTSLDAILPQSREKSLVVTKLQEAAHWASATRP